MLMQDSIFTRIIKGEVPHYKVYEDAKTFAFLDNHPIEPGNVLVVPKLQIDHIWDLPPEDYAALMQTVFKVGNKIREEFPQKKRVAVQIEGLDIAHAHVKLFPFDDHAEFRGRPEDSSTPSGEQLALMAERLRIKDEL